MPLIGWIDFSAEQRSQTLKMLDLFREHGAVDELGIGVVRDAFADYFFPGTSTLQTRAKYFLLIPWIVQDLESKMVPSRDFVRLLNQREDAYVEIFEKSASEADGQGIIGGLSREKLKRKPSSLYWRGLSLYGIVPTPGVSLTQYAQGADQRYEHQRQAKALRVRAIEGDPTDDGDIERLRNKSWRICPPPADWQQKLSIDLSVEEAAFLRDTIIQAAPHSLYAHILRNHAHSAIACKRIEEFPFINQLPADLQRMINLALDFALLIEGAHIRFNMLVQDSRGENRNDAFDDEFLAWEADMASFPWQRWDVGSLSAAFRLPAHTLSFIRQWTSCVKQSEWAEADRLIRIRETMLKHGRSKLANPAKMAGQNDWIGIRGLTYRWPEASRHIKDIVNGRKGGALDA